MAFLGFPSTECDDLHSLHQNQDDSYFDRINKKYEGYSLRYNTNMDTFSVHAVKQEPSSPSSDKLPISDITKDYTDEHAVTRHIVTDKNKVFLCETTVKQELYTPPARTLISQPNMRKSLSTNDLHTLEHSLQQFDLNFKETKPYRSSTVRKNRQANALQTRFVAMAEQIYHLHRDTPKRFHSTFKQDQKKLDTANNRRKAQHVQCTVPQSPALICKNRSRPITAISQREIEEKEIEEIRNYRIKANPIPRSVTSSAPSIIAKDLHRKATTVPVPFKLTEIKKKEPQSEEEKFVFTAKPAPKPILARPQLLKKKPVHVTVPISPNLHKAKARSEECLHKQLSPMQLDRHDHMHDNKVLGYKYDRAGRAEFGEVDIGHTQVPLAMRKPVKPVKPMPFSFEKRNEDAKHKKEEKIKKVFEEEKKMREFKAKPIPGVIKKKLTTSRNFSLDKIKANKENKSDNIPKKIFEAKPATVLKKEPFAPVLDALHVIIPCPFNLSSEQRACERDNFNKQIKEKENECSRRRAQAEEKRRAEEEREVARFRSQLVHHAQPVRHYAPVQLKPSHLPLTVPESPQFSNRSANKK